MIIERLLHKHRERERTSSCLDKICEFIEKEADEIPDHVLIMTVENWSLVSFNRKIVLPEVAQEKNQWSYHLAFCKLGEDQLPELVLDPSMRQPQFLPFLEYLLLMFPRPSEEEAYLGYYVLPISDFIDNLRNQGRQSFNPFSSPKEVSYHLTMV